jgi:hypothetical protein
MSRAAVQIWKIAAFSLTGTGAHTGPLPFVPHGAKAGGMARHRHPLFRQRWFADDIIITCVRWYLRFKLSYRELAELAR